MAEKYIIVKSAMISSIIAVLIGVASAITYLHVTFETRAAHERDVQWLLSVSRETTDERVDVSESEIALAWYQAWALLGQEPIGDPPGVVWIPEHRTFRQGNTLKRIVGRYINGIVYVYLFPQERSRVNSVLRHEFLHHILAAIPDLLPEGVEEEAWIDSLLEEK